MKFVSLTSIILLVAFVGAFVSAQRGIITPVEVPGFDIIFSNDTSFLDEVSWFRTGMYVAGDGYIYQVNEYPTFNMTLWPVFSQRHSFLDFRAFLDATGNEWVVGPISNQGIRGNESRPGMNYPFMLSGSHLPFPAVEAPPGYYMMNSVAVDNSTTGLPLAYFAGWHQHENASEGVNFTIIRVVLNLHNAANPRLGPVFEYDHALGRAYLHSEDFVAYNREFKPWLFHSEAHYHLIVVDPATNSIFRVETPRDTSLPVYYNHTGNRFRIEPFFSISGATYDALLGHVYIGLAGSGVYPGRILVVDVFAMRIVANVSLVNYESNPKSLSLDAYGPGAQPKNLYVGLFGSHSVLQISLSNHQVVGIATLPIWMQNVYSVSVGVNHIYFITNEQHSKVGRFNKTDFCPTYCDAFYGHCSLGKCVCNEPWLTLDHNNVCHYSVPTPYPTPKQPTPWPSPIQPTQHPTLEPGKPTPTPTKSAEELKEEIKQDKGGEIALGILFAIVFIVAAVGWYLVWKSRGGRGVYESLINKG